MADSISIKVVETRTIIIDWPQIISESINHQVQQLKHAVINQFASEIVETVSTYCSLTLYLKEPVDLQFWQKRLHNLYGSNHHSLFSSPSTWCLPVCYDVSLALDLKQLADSKRLCVERVIQIHSKPIYHVYFLGFLPGFPYLGGLDPQLFSSRLKSPRNCIPKGSVAIGDHQTGIYPSASPGGWNLIGRTPINLFDIDRDPVCFIKAGDKIKFNSICLEQYNEIIRNMVNQSFDIQSLKCD